MKNQEENTNNENGKMRKNISEEMRLSSQEEEKYRREQSNTEKVDDTKDNGMIKRKPYVKGRRKQMYKGNKVDIKEKEKTFLP